LKANIEKEAGSISHYQFPRGADIMARILIVDDEPEIVVLTKMMLEKEDHEVSVAKDSAECFEKLKVERPDLILLDIMMPGGDDGWKTCRKIKTDEKTRDIPVAMFTVRTSEDSVEKSYQCGADTQINKPFGKEELLDTVENLIKASTS
jgi:CheY-like chemotaxis protein